MISTQADPVDWTDPFDALRTGQTFSTRARAVAQAPIDPLAVLPLGADLLPLDADQALGVRRAAATFDTPVRLGDTVRVEGQIAGLDAETDDTGVVTLAWQLLNQRDEVVCSAHVDVVWRRDGFVPIPL